VSSEPAFPDVIVSTRPKERTHHRTRRIPPYNVILENDDFHSFGFVVEVLQKALGYAEQRATLLTQEAHVSGRAVVWTGPREVAELKRDQILTFHEIRAADNHDFGPLGCRIEPAPGA
jgi:ATP-dependent Clp protease adaptor protein ClpS